MTAIRLIYYSKMKAVRRKEWEKKKISLIQESKWSDSPRASGKLLNPGNKYCMNLAVRCVKAVNAMQD